MRNLLFSCSHFGVYFGHVWITVRALVRVLLCYGALEIVSVIIIIRNELDVQYLLRRYLLLMHSFSVNSANIAITHIFLLKTRLFGLHLCRRHYESI